MTFETKVGLLVGMGFIVCFAVVLSNRGPGDQLSARMAYQVLAQHRRSNGAVAMTVPNMFVRPPTGAGRIFGGPTELDASPGREYGLGVSRTRPPANAAAPGAATEAERADKTESVDSGAPVGRPNSRGDGLNDGRSDDSTERASEEPTWESLFGTGEEEDDGEQQATEAAASDSVEQAVDRAMPPVPEPKGARYVVAAHDTLWRVAQKAYGKGSPGIVEAIFEANRDRLESADELRVGMELVLPRIDGLRSPNIDGQRAPDRVRERKPPVEGKPQYYDIRRGDRYATIAKRFLGDASKWRQIHELNKGIFPDPSKIQHGVRIRIPSTGPTSEQ